MSDQLIAIRYGQWKRWADSYHGWRNGRAGIPQRPKIPGAVTTPHREALIRLAQDVFAREHLEYRRLVAEPHRRIMAEQARLEEAKSVLSAARHEHDREAKELTEAEFMRRRLGESRHPESVIVRRRHKEHRDLRARSFKKVTRAQAQVMTIEAELASALEEAKQHHDAAVIRVQRIHEHIHRRLAIHRRTLIRFHPDGAWVNSAMSVRAPEIPGWALPDCYTPDSVPPPLAPSVEYGPVVGEPAPPPPAELIELRHEITRFGSAEGKAGDDVGFVRLASPLAAAWQFTITKLADGLQLRTRGHAHGPYIGGVPVGTAALTAGAYFDFANCRYTMLDSDHLLREPLGESSIIAADLHAQSGPKPRLTGMSFVQRESTLLAVLGPSGAGKSSLCSALLGELPLRSGRLFVGTLPVETHARQIRDQLGFVPQDTRLHMSLTVEATLHYGFSLRSPIRSKRTREERVALAINDTGLGDQRHQLLSTLSGGQLRRVSIAVELLTDPALLMLDEPTSGLDASMDRHIMGILRKNARPGHTVIVVTHATEHLGLAHKILVVVEGGAPVYSGPPMLIRGHFHVEKYADLMSLLGDAEQRESPARAYQRGQEAGDAVREADCMEQQIAAGPAGPPGPPDKPDKPDKEARRFFRDAPRQFRVLVKRQVVILATRALKDNDRAWGLKLKNALLVSLPLLIATGSAALAALVAGPPGLGVAKPSDVGPTSLALLTTLCVLSGQALTYSDVVNEIDIIRREFRAGVGVLPVLTAKWLVYAVLAVMQAGLITVVFCAVPQRAPQRSVLLGPELDLFAGLAALSIAAMTLGLLISALSTKLEHAVAIVTATSIAQIALNGVTSDLSQTSTQSLLAGLLPDRWGLAATAASVDLRGIEHGNPALAGKDALWTHTAGQWGVDLAALGALSVVFFVVAVWWLNGTLDPGKIRAARVRRVVRALRGLPVRSRRSARPLTARGASGWPR